jgi:transposase
MPQDRLSARKVAREPEALAVPLADFTLLLTRLGFEARSLSLWLYAKLQKAAYDVVLLKTGYVKAAFSAMAVETDVCTRCAPSCESEVCA